MGRAPCCQKVGLRKGRWTAEEDGLLLSYIKAHGEGCWRFLPKNAGLLRCGKSCRLRWVNYLRDGLKRGNVTQEEEDMIIKLQSSLGNRWSAIAATLPGRTDNEIKNYWNAHLKPGSKPEPMRKKTNSRAIKKRKKTIVNKPVNVQDDNDCNDNMRGGTKEDPTPMRTDNAVTSLISTELQATPTVVDHEPPMDRLKVQCTGDEVDMNTSNGQEGESLLLDWEGLEKMPWEEIGDMWEWLCLGDQLLESPQGETRGEEDLFGNNLEKWLFSDIL